MTLVLTCIAQGLYNLKLLLRKKNMILVLTCIAQGLYNLKLLLRKKYDFSTYRNSTGTL